MKYAPAARRSPLAWAAAASVACRLAACQPAADEAPAPAPPGPGDTAPKDNAVQVLDDDRRAVSGVAVVVHDEAGAVQKVLRTDALGQARVLVPRGGSVSTFQRDGQSFTYIDTIVSPPGGTPLYFRGYRTPPTFPAPTALQLALMSPPPGTSYISYTGSCGEGAVDVSQSTLNLPFCLGRVIDVVLFAVDGAGTRIGWGSVLELAAAPGQTLSRTVAITQSTFVRIQMELTEIPGGDDITASLFLNPEGALRRRQPGLWLARVAESAPPGRLEGTLAVPLSLGREGYRTHAGYGFVLPPDGPFGFSGGVGRWQYYRNLPLRSTFAAGAVPRVEMETPDTRDPLHPRLRWRGGGFGDVLDLVVEYPLPDGTSGVWEVWAPADREPVLRLPDIPPELTGYTPQAGVDLSYVEALYSDYDQLQGFDAYLRQQQQLLSIGDVSDKSYTAGNMVLKLE